MCKKFELIPIKVGFLKIFKVAQKIGSKTLYYSTVCLAKYRQK